MNRLDAHHLVERVQTLAGLAESEQAERAIRIVVAVLLEQLTQHDRYLLSDALPAAWTIDAAGATLQVYDDLESFYARIGTREGIAPGFAREHAQSVCRALSEALDDDTRQRLITRLPDAIAELLVSSDGGPSQPAGLQAPGITRSARSLATARPGSSRPLSEGRADRAHKNSVAVSDNPHADTKLSSARGTTQERESETLAVGKGGAADSGERARKS
jgi:uncharacterized protein (DUF2267 family)